MIKLRSMDRVFNKVFKNGSMLTVTTNGMYIRCFLYVDGNKEIDLSGSAQGWMARNRKYLKAIYKACNE